MGGMSGHGFGTCQVMDCGLLSHGLWHVKSWIVTSCHGFVTCHVMDCDMSSHGL